MTSVLSRACTGPAGAEHSSSDAAGVILPGEVRGIVGAKTAAFPRSRGVQRSASVITRRSADLLR